MEKASGRGFSVVFLAVIGAVAALFLVNHITDNQRWVNYVQLMQKGSTCQGTITRADAGISCLVEYSFTIGGRAYTGSGQNCSATVGEKVTVTYIADAPASSCLGRPGEKLADEVAYSLFGGLSFPSILY